MSAIATTKLQFTLTSPGTDPSPSPSPSPTPTPGQTTPTGTSTVISPYTGESTSANDSFSGSVFTTLFIIIGFAALAIFFVKYLKKNRRLSFVEQSSFRISARPRVVATVSFSAMLALLGGLAIANIYKDRNTNAASSRNLDISAASSLTFNVDRGGSNVLSDIITVDTKGAKYDLYAYAENGDNKFTLESDSSTYLNSVAGTLGSSDLSKLVAISTNQWGVSLSKNADVNGQAWGTAPLTETLIKKDVTEKTTDVSYGVVLGNNLPDGTYSTKVSYKAIAKNYKVTVINGYVNTTGTDNVGWFDADVTVMIRQNCSSTQVFKGWKVIEGLNNENVITLVSDKTYNFTMPANDVTVQALCEGDTPEPGTKWVIKYNKNIDAATGTMSDQTITETTATLTPNTFAYTDHTFKGWACTSGDPENATLVKFTDGQSGITQDALTAAGCTKTPGVPDINPPTYDSYTIYAIWETGTPTPPPIGNIWIQDVTPDMCGIGSSTEGIKLFEIVYLPDKRTEAAAPGSGYIYESTYTYGGVTRNTPDGQKHIWYPFTKFADGRCWMLQDLAYQPGTGSVALTTDGSDISENRTVNFANSYHVGTGTYSNLYNYKAASGGWYTGSNLNEVKNVPDSLCPANWKIPDSWNIAQQTYGDQSGELSNLATYNIGKSHSGGSTMSNEWKLDSFLLGDKNVTVGSESFPTPHFTYNGAWDFTNNRYVNNGSDSGEAGSYASYFINTVKDTGRIMAFNPHKTGSDHRLPFGQSTDPAHGSAVRCLLRTATQRTNKSAGAEAGDVTNN